MSTHNDLPAPYGPTPSPRQLKWHTLETYAFLHFTTNTFTDKEWGYGDESPSIFNPTQFSAKQIISSLKAAGLKAAILTCKHHDGFCLWPTKTTKHNISASPYRNGKGDIVGELARECQKQGLKFGVYLSPWDRNNALYGSSDYVTKVYREQLRELLTWYGPIFETWHDGANGGDGYYGGKRESRQIDRTTYYDWPTTWQLIRELQPDACVWSDIGWDARWVGTERGFAGDPCWHTITIGPKDGVGQMDEKKLLSGERNGKSWIPAEVDFSIRPGWFWHEAQNKLVKSPAQLMTHYLESVGRGASMLLNIPPDRRGLVHELDASSLKIFGEHLKKTFTKNLAIGAKLTASNTRHGSDPKHLLDGSRETAWYTDDPVLTPELTLELGRPKTFNIIRLREAIALGQRIDEAAIDIWQDDSWVEVAKAQSIGSCRLWRIPTTTTDKVRIRVTKAAACPALSDFGLFLEPPMPAWSAKISSVALP
jgi:alpha-L-fucosidase